MEVIFKLRNVFGKLKTKINRPFLLIAIGDYKKLNCLIGMIDSDNIEIIKFQQCSKLNAPAISTSLSSLG